MKADPQIKAVKKALSPKQNPVLTRGMLSTGSTLLNLACSGRPFSGFARGGYYLLVGDSTSGKTALAGTCFAEAAINPKFDDYALYFDNVENGALMFDKFFGEKIAKRIEAPCYDGDTPLYSQTVEEFYYNAHRCLKNHKGIYILDSENALSSEAEVKKQKEKRKAIHEDTETAGTMTDAKAKVHSQNLRGLCALLRDTGSILIMISQSRDNMGFAARFEKQTRPGGRALKFYAMLEMWSSVKQHIKKTVRGKPREIGIVAQVKVKKNRFTGKNRTIEIPIYHSFGFDDLGSCIDYLVSENHWSKKGGTIDAKEFDFEGSKEDLIKRIEENNLEKELRILTGDVWQEIEAACEVVRKPKYA